MKYDIKMSQDDINDITDSIVFEFNFEAPVVFIRDSQFSAYIKSGYLTKNELLILNNPIEGHGNLFDLLLKEEIHKQYTQYVLKHGLPHRLQEKLPIFTPNELFTSEIIEDVKSGMNKWRMITDLGLNEFSTSGLKSNVFIIHSYE